MEISKIQKHIRNSVSRPCENWLLQVSISGLSMYIPNINQVLIVKKDFDNCYYSIYVEWGPVTNNKYWQPWDFLILAL